MTARKRREKESYADYRASLIIENRIEKIKRQGRMMWNSSKNGTYRKGSE